MGRPPWLTPEQREASRIKQNRRRTLATIARRKAKRAAAAAAKGRVPGQIGGTRKLSDEERRRHRVEAVLRHKRKNLEKVCKAQRDAARAMRAVRAIAAGRMPGRIGRERSLTPEEFTRRRRLGCLAYWKKHPELRKELARKYYKEHRDEVFQNCRNRRARKRNAAGTHTVADIRMLREKQNGKCAFCLKPLGKKTPHIDHYVPLQLGGSNDRSNLRLLHPKCNLQKAAKHPIDFALENGLLCF